MKTNKIERLIKRIKEVPFNEALEIMRPDLDIPEPPGMMCCPLHNENTPSFGVRDEFFKCFGCQKGGDIIDFVAADQELEWGKAVNYVQYKLGFAKEDIETLIDIVNMPKKIRTNKSEWRDRVQEIEYVFLARIKPYLKCRDPFIYDMAWSVSAPIFEAFEELKSLAPTTRRAKSKAIDGIIKYARGYLGFIERESLRMTGKDRIDVDSQEL